MAEPNTSLDRVIYDPLEHHLTRDIIVNILNGKALYLFGNVYHNGVPFIGASEDIRAHGAVEGGTIDNSAAFLDAILTANSKVPVFIPDGIWGLSSEVAPTIPTVFQSAPGSTAKVKIINGASCRAFNIQNIPNVKFKDFEIDCNRANTPDNGTTTQHGIYYNATNSTGCPGASLERMIIKNAWDRGLSATATVKGTNPLDIDLSACDISGCVGNNVFISNYQRLLAQLNNIHDGLLWGFQAVGGDDASILYNRFHDHAGGVNRGHGAVINTGGQITRFIGNRMWNNESVNSWGAVLGINSILFIVALNIALYNAGGMTMDVADTTTNPVEVDSIVSSNITSHSTLSDGLHVNQCNGLGIVGHIATWNEQDGISVYGRNANVSSYVVHDNGRDGVNFEEDLTPPLATSGPHRCWAGHSYNNNRNLGAWKDHFSALLSNGPVVWDITGAGSPEGVLRGGRGSIYRRTDAGAGGMLYIKETGVDNTGWKVIPGITQSAPYTQTYATADRTHAAFVSALLSGISSSTTGSALAEPSAIYTQSEMQQNFRRLQDQYNNLRGDVDDLKQLANAIIDDLQMNSILG